ncbi:zinc ribbon domain-containing protein YjdM [Erwinia sorbitola]|uniref:Alkylphosphonate utilization protein n=1 Tax=Erwinia sorbitola TaxID=2681984 RepID=A0A6I6ET90_9GAMM|nr:zinc ribbon domain-containing protein YjdM [Erwinia sorbitola]MTD28847.1 alkylphosphonate utilization protein [Erwinia sorbitola]QGU89496.1 alkylphosphonate utilization protein [Erwinia sorbitola]
MQTLPPCPKCSSEYSWQDAEMLNCPECGHVWAEGSETVSEFTLIVKDAFGNLLEDGDTITVIKDLRVKGSSTPVKMGTKVKGIRLVEGDHNIDCKIDGLGQMKLKSEFVKKA